MTEKDTGHEPDEFFVPTPEELERGIGRAGRKRRRSGPQETSGRGKLTELARRLFRLRADVGRERSEAPAPTPPPASLGPSSSSHSAHPSSLREDVDDPVHESSSAAPQPLDNRQARDQRTAHREPAKPTTTPPSSPTEATERRLRRVTVPERVPLLPVRKTVVPSPVPKWVREKASQRGHELSPFIVQRSALASEQEQRCVAKCVNCKSTAYAIRSADQNWTLKDTPWQTQGPAFEKSCPGHT